MVDTLNLLNPLVDVNLLKFDLDDLAVMYQASPESSILATSYKKIYKLACVCNRNYWGLNEADYASFCLEKLDYCLRTYVPGNKFTTYFCRVYENKLREETEALNRKKRKCILESINDLINVGVEDTYDLLSCILPKTLTQREYELCELEAAGYDKAYCAEVLGVSRMTVCNMEKSLRTKLSSIYF